MKNNKLITMSIISNIALLLLIVFDVYTNIKKAEYSNFDFVFNMIGFTIAIVGLYFNFFVDIDKD